MESNKISSEQDAEKRKDVRCPICFLMDAAGQLQRRHSTFFNHLANAQIELLQAVKALVDRRISALEERKHSWTPTRSATKIEVE